MSISDIGLSESSCLPVAYVLFNTYTEELTEEYTESEKKVIHLYAPVP